MIDSFYLVTLGSYRAFYILNWILRGIMEHHFAPIPVIFGLIQTAFYLDFAWVYWTRQRVKLRNGGVVDSDDLSRGWLVARVLGKGRDSVDEEEVLAQDRPQGGATKSGRGKWGTMGVSISADDPVSDLHQDSLGDDGADIGDREEVLSPRGGAKATNNAISDGSEWRNASE